MDIIIIIVGLLILLLGGDSLVKGAVSIARHLKLSKVLVSSVIVGFGTSMPEMTVSVEAMLAGLPEVAIGNVIGSNIANILMILGISAVISPFALKGKTITRDVIAMLLATVFLTLFGAFGFLNYWHGVAMILFLIAYISYSYQEDKKNLEHSSSLIIEEGFKKEIGFLLSFIISLAGIGLLILGSALFLHGAMSIADTLNVSKEVAGLGIVALGSCLPELTTTITASCKKQGDVAIAGIVGSNIFNILSIVGVISLIDRITLPQHIVELDLWVFLIVTFCLGVMLLKGVKFTRSVGALFILSYIAYLYLLFSS